MAAVAAEAPMSQEHMEDRALRALQVVAVSGLYSGSALAESCLTLCNVCREGLPWECIRVEQDMEPSLWPVFLPNAMAGWQTELEPTRVLPPRRVRKVLWTFEPKSEDVREAEETIRSAIARDEDSVRSESEEDAGDALHDALIPFGLGEADLRRVQWPEGVKELQLLVFDESLEGVAWPSGLERLSFQVLNLDHCVSWSDRGYFDQFLHGVSFPSGLREMFLGERFDRPLQGVELPLGLERLSLPGYRHSIDNVRWPPALKSLEFLPPDEIATRIAPDVHPRDLDVSRTGFNSHFTTLPASLETLWLSDGFQQPLEGVVWPSGLSTLGLGASFSTALMSSISWPSSLRRLYSIRSIDEADSLPAGCTVAVVMGYDTYSQSLDLDFECGFFGDMDGPYYFNSPYGPAGDDFHDEGYGTDEYDDYDSPVM
ncbi:unnamed protein product [Scytosiphon promiscuus]